MCRDFYLLEFINSLAWRNLIVTLRREDLPDFLRSGRLVAIVLPPRHPRITDNDIVDGDEDMVARGDIVLRPDVVIGNDGGAG